MRQPRSAWSFEKCKGQRHRGSFITASHKDVQLLGKLADAAAAARATMITYDPNNILRIMCATATALPLACRRRPASRARSQSAQRAALATRITARLAIFPLLCPLV
jgi:hypothetical protein